VAPQGKVRDGSYTARSQYLISAPVRGAPPASAEGYEPSAAQVTASRRRPPFPVPDGHLQPLTTVPVILSTPRQQRRQRSELPPSRHMIMSAHAHISRHAMSLITSEPFRRGDEPDACRRRRASTAPSAGFADAVYVSPCLSHHAVVPPPPPPSCPARRPSFIFTHISAMPQR